MKGPKKLLKNALAYDIFNDTNFHAATSALKATSSGFVIPKQKSLVFLHGILGSKRNWRTPANVFRKLHPDFKCVTVDLRGHGDSHTTENNPKWENNTVHESAIDLHNLFRDPEIGISDTPTILCAHSFGGKVALKYLERLYLTGQDLPDHTWILDSLPGPYLQPDDSGGDINSTSELQSVFKVLQVIQSLPSEFPSRDWMINEIISKGIDKPIAQWLGTNIKTLPNKQSGWSFNLPVIHELFEDFCTQNLWHFLETYQGNSKIHFIRAGKNPSWTPDVLERFEGIIEKNRDSGNDNILLHTMHHVGHWIHAEDLTGMMKIITRQSGLTNGDDITGL